MHLRVAGVVVSLELWCRWTCARYKLWGGERGISFPLKGVQKMGKHAQQV